MAAEEAVEVGADLVALTLFQVVALLAPRLEEVGTLLLVTWDLKLVLCPADGSRWRMSPGEQRRWRMGMVTASGASANYVPSHVVCASPMLPSTFFHATPALPLSLMRLRQKQDVPSEKLSLPIVSDGWMR